MKRAKVGDRFQGRVSKGVKCGDLTPFLPEAVMRRAKVGDRMCGSV
jgi:hypothetical protein